MIIGFADRGWEDYQYWMANDKKTLKRINERHQKKSG